MKRMKRLVCKIKEAFYVCHIDLSTHVFVSLCFVFGFILKSEVQKSLILPFRSISCRDFWLLSYDLLSSKSYFSILTP